VENFKALDIKPFSTLNQFPFAHFYVSSSASQEAFFIAFEVNNRVKLMIHCPLITDASRTKEFSGKS
jgi:hypothetical protein